MAKGKDWQTLRTMLDTTTAGALHVLKTGTSTEEILRAQGRVQGIESFISNVETIVAEAIEEINEQKQGESG